MSSSESDQGLSRAFAIADGTLVSVAQSAAALSQLYFSAGTVVDNKYRIVAPIGEGGMGAVYRVDHLLLNRQMALKTFRTNNLSEESWLRFQREAQSIAKLEHPNIIKVYDFGVLEGNLPYYTMELLSGKSLAEKLADGPLSLSESLAIFLSVVEGLEHAHKAGIVHRDIKPPNIFLNESSTTRDGLPVPKLVDFGIAKLSTSQSQNLTAIGLVFGSPLYMSPEQSMGMNVDGRSDIYSLGCTIFETLTGKTPFYGATIMETLMCHQTVPPPRLADVRPEVEFPQRLEGLVAKMMAKKFTERFQTMAEVADELRLIQGNLKMGRVAGGASTLPPALGRADDMRQNRTTRQFGAEDNTSEITRARDLRSGSGGSTRPPGGGSTRPPAGASTRSSGGASTRPPSGGSTRPPAGVSGQGRTLSGRAGGVTAGSGTAGVNGGAFNGVGADTLYDDQVEADGGLSSSSIVDWLLARKKAVLIGLSAFSLLAVGTTVLLLSVQKPVHKESASPGRLVSSSSSREVSVKDPAATEKILVNHFSEEFDRHGGHKEVLETLQGVETLSQEEKSWLSDSRPVSHFTGKPPNEMRVFDFPKGTAVGRVETFALKPEGKPACGHLEFKRGQPLVFLAGPLYSVNPKLFAKFNKDDFVSLKVSEGQSLLSGTIMQISGLTGISELSLQGADVQGMELFPLGNMPNLISLNLCDNQHIGVGAIAGTSWLKRLEQFKVNKLGGLHRLLADLLTSGRVKNLELEECQFTRQDLQLISKLPGLTRLDLLGSNVGDDLVDELANSKALTELKIGAHQGKLTAASLKSFVRMKHLKYLTVILNCEQAQRNAFLRELNRLRPDIEAAID